MQVRLSLIDQSGKFQFKKKCTDGQIKKFGDYSLRHNDILGKMNYDHLFFFYVWGKDK